MHAIDHPPLRKLLTRFASKAQRAGGGLCTQKLDSKTFPELFLADTGEDADYVWLLLKDAAAVAGVTVSLKPTKQLCAEYERAPKLEISADKLPCLLNGLGLVPAAPSYREEWKAALLSGLDAPPAVVQALMGFNVKIEGKCALDIVQALNQLRQLKGELLLLREVSSKVFWGLSKVLDDRGDMVAKLLEVDECPFPEPPLQLSVRLPHGPVCGVLFVENKTTFNTLGLTGDTEQVDGLALIYSAGFLASARRLTTRSKVHCYFSEHSGLETANAKRVEEFLFENAFLPCYFFGDLDFSGMAIVKALRKNFPLLRTWEPGYTKLLARLQRGEGHTAVAAGKAGQKDPGRTGCALADEVLLPAMRKVGLFVDQE